MRLLSDDLVTIIFTGNKTDSRYIGRVVFRNDALYLGEVTLTSLGREPIVLDNNEEIKIVNDLDELKSDSVRVINHSDIFHDAMIDLDKL